MLHGIKSFHLRSIFTDEEADGSHRRRHIY